MNSVEDLVDFRDWLVKYGRVDSTANQYMSSMKMLLREKDPLLQLVNKDLSPKYLRFLKSVLKAWSEFTEDSALAQDLTKIKLPPAIRTKESVPLDRTGWVNLRNLVESSEAILLVPPPMRAVLRMLVCRGFRVADVLRITNKEATDALRKGVLSFEGKGRKRLKFTVTDYWRDSLETFVGKTGWDRVEDLISPSASPESRRKSSGRSVARALKKMGKLIGLDPTDMHPHLLRKTYATLYYQQCLDPVKLQAHMQWSDISTAMGYVAAGEVEELDDIADSLFQ